MARTFSTRDAETIHKVESNKKGVHLFHGLITRGIRSGVSLAVAYKSYVVVETYHKKEQRLLMIHLG